MRAAQDRREPAPPCVAIALSLGPSPSLPPAGSKGSEREREGKRERREAQQSAEGSTERVRESSGGTPIGRLQWRRGEEGRGRENRKGRGG